MKFKYRWWGKGDVDASIGIFFDGFSKILSATGIMLFVFGMPADIVLGKIVPGVGLAIFAGNLWYFYEAWSLAKKEHRQDVTAQPFGIGASQLTGWLYLIMGPVYWQTGDAELAFQVGLAASLIGGFIEVLGGFIGRWIVKVVPHSALMGNMASSALVWLSFVGIAMVFDKPLYALLPFCMVVVDYLGKADKRFQKIPTGVVAVVLGAVIAWCSGYLTWDNFAASFSNLGFYPPTFCGGDIVQGMKGIFPFLPVIIPLQINNFLSTLQGIEAAKAVGDSYPERRSMVMDGCSTMLGSLFGNPFPTTVYFGHPGWKELGARARVLLGERRGLPAHLPDRPHRRADGSHPHRGGDGAAGVCGLLRDGRHLPGAGQEVRQRGAPLFGAHFVPVYPDANQLLCPGGGHHGGRFDRRPVRGIFRAHPGHSVFGERCVPLQPAAGGAAGLRGG